MKRTLITPDEAADLLGVAAKTVARWSDEGRLWRTFTAGGQRRYDQAEVKNLARDLAGKK